MEHGSETGHWTTGNIDGEPPLRRRTARALPPSGLHALQWYCAAAGACCSHCSASVDGIGVLARHGYRLFSVTLRTVSTKKRATFKGKTRTRTHVVWDYDKSKLLRAFQNHGTGATHEGLPAPRDQVEITSEGSTRADELVIDIDAESSSSVQGDLWMPSMGPSGAGSSSGRHFRWVWNSACPSVGANARGTVEPLPEWVRAAYEDGSTVEYYSCHNDQWCLAVVSLAALHMEPLGPKSFVAVVYNVVIGRSGQQRTDVEVRFMRRPLCPHESVEVRTPTSGVWQAAHILKAAQSNLGRAYKVALDGEGDASLVLPATSIRRRFADGSIVFVYRGTTDGWVSGVLQQCAPSEHSDCPSMAGSSMPLVRVTRTCGGKLGSPVPLGSTECANVDQREFSVSCGGRQERVPAYLLDSVGRSCSGEEGTILV